MTAKKRIIFAIALLFLFVVFAVFGQYTGGLVYYKLASIPLQYLEVDSLYSGWVTYKDNSAVRKFLDVGVTVAFILSLLPVVMGIIVIFTRKGEEIHGSARLANDDELTASGHFPVERKEPSLLLGKMNAGKYKGQFVELVGKQFLGVSAPTGSGKGVGIVIPNLVNYCDSVVNTDIKLENFFKTAGYRKSQGQDVFLFAPDGYAVTEEDRLNGVLRSHRWNPFYYVRREPEYRVGDILIMTASLYPLTGDGDKDIWPASAGKLFLGLALWMLDTEKHTKKEPTIPYMMSLRGIKGGVVAWMQREAQQGYLSEECELEFNKFIDTHEETRSGILTNFDSPLTIFSDKIVASAVSGNDFDFRELRRKGISLYIGVQPPNLARFKGLLNLFVEQIINENTRVLPELDSSLNRQCLMLLDEFPALGRVNQIKTSIGFTRQYNLRYVLIYQDKSQLEDRALYGKEGADNITSNFAAEVIYPPKEVNKRVEEISKTLGTKTVKVRNHSSSDSQSLGLERKHSRSYTQQKRELYKPHEIVELGFKKHPVIPIGIDVLLLKENQRSFLMEKIIYPFEEAINERVEYSKANVQEVPRLIV